MSTPTSLSNAAWGAAWVEKDFFLGLFVPVNGMLLALLVFAVLASKALYGARFALLKADEVAQRRKDRARYRLQRVARRQMRANKGGAGAAAGAQADADGVSATATAAAVPKLNLNNNQQEWSALTAWSVDSARRRREEGVAEQKATSVTGTTERSHATDRSKHSQDQPAATTVEVKPVDSDALERQRLTDGDGPGAIAVTKPLMNKANAISLDLELVSRDNVAVAISYASFIISICLVLGGAHADNGHRGTFDILDFAFELLWFVTGLVMVLLSMLCIHHTFLAGYFRAESLLQRNTATALVEAGGFLGAGIIVHAIVSSKGTNNVWEGYVNMWVLFVEAMILFLGLAWTIQRITLPQCRQLCQQRNAAAGVRVFTTLFGLGLVMAAPILASPALISLALASIVGAFLVGIAIVFTGTLVVPAASVSAEMARDENWGFALIELGVVITVALAQRMWLPTPWCA